MNIKNEKGIDIKESENLVVNTEGVIIGTNASDKVLGLVEGCILIADSRPVKYLECNIIDGKKIFVLSDNEINRINKEIENDLTDRRGF
ncbi:MAG: hypothetical protein M0Q88_02985 [Bacilli bacterium]|nr:hypothetical protein [Bacilli bacterium]